MCFLFCQLIQRQLLTSWEHFFATHGIPNSVVTDNATGFVSEEMRKFWKNNGIRHITSSPYHLATNGLAERAVQTFKAGFKRMTSGSVETKIAKFLFNYCITPQGTTGSTQNCLWNEIYGHTLIFWCQMQGCSKRSSIDYWTITTDLWTSSHPHSSYISLTVHFVDSLKFVLNSMYLQTPEVPKEHTTVAIE